MDTSGESTLGKALPLTQRASSQRSSGSEALACTVLAHPDVKRVGDRAVLGELSIGRPASLSRLQPDFFQPDTRVGSPLQDPYLSRQPLIIQAMDGGWQFSNRGSTTIRVSGTLLQGSLWLQEDAFDQGIVIELSERMVLLLHRLPPPVEPLAEIDAWIGANPRSIEVVNEVARVADQQVNVLIRGETGTGKELIAQALHTLGERAQKPFVAVNLGALPASLAAGELFGATRGAYTGASERRTGSFAQAHGGTLFLDEIGEAPVEVQVAMLRALETREVLPLGGSKPQRIDVRVVAATDADLDQRIDEGRFKAPLLHRLAGYEIWIPPLRMRRDDIGRLLVHFLRRQDRELGGHRFADSSVTWIDTGLMRRLVQFDWPGNVRQLRNVTRQLAIGNRERFPIQSVPAVDRLLAEVPARACKDTPPIRESVSPPSIASISRQPIDLDDAEILEVMQRERYEIKAAADALGISRAALYARIEKSELLPTAGRLDDDDVRRAHRELHGDLDALVQRLQVSRFALRRRLRELGL